MSDHTTGVIPPIQQGMFLHKSTHHCARQSQKRPWRRSTAVQATEYGTEKGPRRGKTAARSTAQIIKAANGTEHCQCILQPSHRRTDDTLGGHSRRMIRASRRRASRRAHHLDWCDCLPKLRMRLGAMRLRGLVGCTISPSFACMLHSEEPRSGV